MIRGEGLDTSLWELCQKLSLGTVSEAALGNCVRSCTMYEIGSETWPMKLGHESMLERTDM